MTEDDIQVVIEHELALLRPEVRRAADHLETILAPDFTEIGASGRLWNRHEIISALVADWASGQSPIECSDMTGKAVGSDFVLLTFVTEVDGRRVRRSSLWRCSRAREWRIVHHQGTPVP